MTEKKPVAFDFETFSKNWVHTDEGRISQEDEHNHNEYNFQQIKAKFGKDRLDEIFTAILLVYGPVKERNRTPHLFAQKQTLTGFRKVLEQVSGIQFSLNETLPWFAEYEQWMQDNQNTRSPTTRK